MSFEGRLPPHADGLHRIYTREYLVVGPNRMINLQAWYVRPIKTGVMYFSTSTHHTYDKRHV